MQTILRLAFWAAAAGAFLLAALPHPPIALASSDKMQHALAFVVLAALGVLAYPRLRILALLVGLAAFGAVIEIVQMIPQLHRDPEVIDWLADTAAAAVILGAVHLWRRRSRQG